MRSMLAQFQSLIWDDHMKYYRKPAGHYIELEDSVPVSSTFVHVSRKPSPIHVFSDSWQLDPLNPNVCWTIDLAAHKVRKFEIINAGARQRIIQYYGLLDGKQSNMQKRGLELIRKRAMGLVLTTTEASEETVLLQAGAFIDSVRSAARAAKDAVQASTTVAEVDAVVVSWPTTTPPGWPL